jgi:hypothetical protein
MPYFVVWLEVVRRALLEGMEELQNAPALTVQWIGDFNKIWAFAN